MTIVEERTPVTLTDTPEKPSMDQLRKLMENPDAEIPEKVAADETGKPEPTKETAVVPEPELPRGVDKKLGQESAKQEELDRLIAEAVNKTKAKQAELEKLTGAQGSEPVKTPKPEETTGNPPPLPPDFLTWTGTGEEYAAALAKYHKDYPEWLLSQTRERVQGEFRAQKENDAAKARWDKAAGDYKDKDGKQNPTEFNAKIDSVIAVAPESMQEAISQLEDWSKVAVHLANNPAELTALADKFKSNPIAATAQLGRIEERITAAAIVAPPAPKPKPRVPAPLSPVEAPAEEGTGEFDYDAATPAQRRAYLVRGGVLE